MICENIYYKILIKWFEMKSLTKWFNMNFSWINLLSFSFSVENKFIDFQNENQSFHKVRHGNF